ncbi:MAG: hypothetical protein ABSG40_18970 [Terriglobales bacterium]|jgi:hypothetical protein
MSTLPQQTERDIQLLIAQRLSEMNLHLANIGKALSHISNDLKHIGAKSH